MGYNPATDGFPDYQHVFWDQNGSPYWMTDKGKQIYIAPAAAAQMHEGNPDWERLKAWGESSANAQPGRGFIHDRGTWNPQTGQWDQGLNWDNILSLAVGGGMAAPYVAGALGAGAGGAAFDAAPNIASATGAANAASLGAGSATLPSAMSALAQGAGFDTAPNIGTATGAANAAGVNGVIPSSALPTGVATAPNVASQGASAGVPFATTGGTSLLKNILSGIKEYAPLGLAGANAVRQLTQGAPQAQQDLQSILKLAEGRINQTEPLFQALNAMSQAGLPDYSKGIR